MIYVTNSNLPSIIRGSVSGIMAFLAAIGTISGSSLLSFVVQIVIVGLIFWLMWWFVGYVAPPEPFNKVIRVIIGLAAMIYLINLLLGLAGQPLFR